MPTVCESNYGRRLGILLATATPLAFAFAVPSAFAQEAAPSRPADTVETGNDIIVTATKRGSETIQDVPLSIQAVTGDQLAARGASDVNDFFRLIPGLAVQDTGPGDKRYVVRGINAAGPGTVGVYLNEIIVTGENAQDGGGQQTDIKLFDIDRVEVLKGPQGTTFGSSSLAGTVRYITNQPILNENSVAATGELRATKGASLGYQANGAVNLSVVPDVLAIRASGFYTHLPGYIDSRFGKGINGEKTGAGRLMAKLAITPDLTLSATGMYQRTKQSAKDFYNTTDSTGLPLTGKYYQADVALSPYDDKSQIYNSTLEYRAGIGTFTATASRFVRDLDFSRDASLVAQAFFYPNKPYLGAGRSVIYQPKHRRVDSYEARYASHFGGRLEILAGVFGQDEHRNFASIWDTVNSQGVLDLATATTLLARSVDTRIRERAVFGEANLTIVDGLKLTVGGRYYDFKLTEQSNAITAFGGSPGSGPGVVNRAHYSGFIPRFNLAYAASDDVNLYAQVAKGFRAGGNNDQTAAALANVVIPAGYAPDTLWNYEVGAKTTFLNKRLFFNVAGYYIDWSNIQVQLQTNGTVNGTNVNFPYTGNGGGATVKGFEAEFGGRPAAGLSLSLTANYNDAKLSKTNAPPASGNKGDRLPYVPRWSASATVDYDFPLSDTGGLKGTAGGDITYTGDRATELNTTIFTYHRLAPLTLVGLRAGVKTDRWSAMLVGTNIFNNKRVINVTSTIAGVTPDQFYVSRPRTIALRVSTHF